jgi:hypothetical protein
MMEKQIFVARERELVQLGGFLFIYAGKVKVY